jgi:hypothetical protein
MQDTEKEATVREKADEIDAMKEENEAPVQDFPFQRSYDALVPGKWQKLFN